MALLVFGLVKKSVESSDWAGCLYKCVNSKIRLGRLEAAENEFAPMKYVLYMYSTISCCKF